MLRELNVNGVSTENGKLVVDVSFRKRPVESV